MSHKLARAVTRRTSNRVLVVPTATDLPAVIQTYGRDERRTIAIEGKRRMRRANSQLLTLEQIPDGSTLGPDTVDDINAGRYSVLAIRASGPGGLSKKERTAISRTAKRRALILKKREASTPNAR